jgi:hypothetical protein
MHHTRQEENRPEKAGAMLPTSCPVPASPSQPVPEHRAPLWRGAPFDAAEDQRQRGVGQRVRIASTSRRCGPARAGRPTTRPPRRRPAGRNGRRGQRPPIPG